MDEKLVIFEQPLSEYIRICLRLEYLFAQARYFLAQQSTWDDHAALNTIINLLNIADRPDIKSKLTNALHMHVSALTQLKQASEVDKTKLHFILDQLNKFIDILHHSHGKLGQPLLENEFLAAVRQRLNTPAGTIGFTMPAYHSWLQRSLDIRQHDLQRWLASFNQIEAIINLLLQLIRDRSEPMTQKAYQGFYQEPLQAGIPYQMIRIGLAPATNIYPDISIGRHRLAIHFFYLKDNGHGIQVTDDIEFQLTYCKL